MCGFVGTVTPRSGALLSHRGPDGTGGLSDALSWANVSLEMTRLAVVDRRSITVPFNFRKSCGIVLAFNGEIYNWRALRAELSDGLPWETECDAEVVARGWRRWGLDVFHRLNGMWGLALLDEVKGSVILARDRAGEKPLYYTALGSGVAFASEIKALPIKLEEGPCADLETLEFDCLEQTPFKGVFCLAPGSYMQFTKAGDLQRLEQFNWWNLSDVVVDDSMMWSAAVEETQTLLVDSIRLRAACEVPVAVQLSGGLDSAIIQAVVKSDRLYTVTFPNDGVDNFVCARVAALGHEPTAVTFGFAELEQVLSKVAYHLDTPATWTAVCQWFMNKKIAEDGAVVVLSGEGADELFGGYARYRFLWWLEQAGADANLAAYTATGRALFGDATAILSRMLNRGGDATIEHARMLVDRFDSEGGLCERMARIDFHVTMSVLLRMADRMSAAFSLENRSPFLDYRLIELGARMPMRWKINLRESKAVLREVARRLNVSASITEEKTKRGLYVPWARWHRSDGTGVRGEWDRSTFARMMREVWREVFFK